MTRMKWFVLGAVGLGLVAIAFLFAIGAVFGPKDTTSDGGGYVPVYHSDQTASSHDGYRRSTLTMGQDVFVNDYEEAGLQLANPEPSTVIGQRAALGDAKVCSIPGQPVTAYIACDCGSEMPAYVPYRNVNRKPFDWRTATFREMTAHHPKANDHATTDAALLAEVVHALRDGTPVELPSFPFAAMADLASIKMTSDDLPGLQFCPYLFTDAQGQIYLAESLMFDDKTAPTQLHARWIPASPALAQWLKTP